MKKLIGTILSSIMVFNFAAARQLVRFACAEAETSSTALVGDVNGDGIISAVDAAYVLNYYAVLSSEATPEKELDYAIADVNSDGFINAVDASAILRYYAYVSGNGTMQMPEFMEDEENAATATTTTTTTASTTQAPTITAATTTDEEPYIYEKEYTKYDLRDDDPMEAVKAFNDLEGQFNRELFSNYVHNTQYGKTIRRVAGPILAILNYNQGVNIEAMADGDVFGSYSEEECIELCDNMNLADYQYFYHTNVDFRKYLLDEDLALFLNDISYKYKQYRDGNTQPLLDEFDKFFSQPTTDYIKYYFMKNTRAMTGLPSGYYFQTFDEEARNLYIENVVKPFYNEAIQYKEKARQKYY